MVDGCCVEIAAVAPRQVGLTLLALAILPVRTRARGASCSPICLDNSSYTSASSPDYARILRAHRVLLALVLRVHEQMRWPWLVGRRRRSCSAVPSNLETQAAHLVFQPHHKEFISEPNPSFRDVSTTYVRSVKQVSCAHCLYIQLRLVPIPFSPP